MLLMSPREFEAKLQELWKSYGRATRADRAERTVEPEQIFRSGVAKIGHGPGAMPSGRPCVLKQSC